MNWITERLNRQRPPRKFPLSDFERIRHELKMCDVLLVEGRTPVSDIIRWLTNSPWTHAALYIGRIYDIEDSEVRERVIRHYEGDPGDRLVVESLLGHGTIVRSIEAYELDHLRICRPAGLSPGDAQQVVDYATSQIGLDYDVRQIFDLARFLLPWYLLPRKWASSLFRRRAGRPEKTVCSTMIAESFGYVNFPILPLVKHSEDGEARLFRRNPRLCTPSDFDYSPYFKIIKYPFMDFYHEEYHLLPWKGAAMLSSDELDYYVEDAIDDHEVDPDDEGARGDDLTAHDDGTETGDEKDKDSGRSTDLSPQ